MTRVEKAARRDAVREQYASGLLVKEIAERFGITEAYVCTICKDIPREGSHKGFIDVLRSNSVEVIALIKNDVPQREIAERFGVSLHTVKDFTKEQGLSKEPTKINAEEAARRISIKSNGCLQYVSGYTIKEKPVRVRCVVCGGEFERTYHNITTKKGSVACPHCVELKRKARTIEQDRERDERKRKADINKIRNAKQIRLVVCPSCGEVFTTWSNVRVYCSEGCRKRSLMSTQSSDDRLNKTNIVDRGITLDKLFIRDKGVCQICGGLCDYNDYRYNENGVFIAGENYPSKDHIVELSNGGKHSWDNIRLAHRGCNSKLYWKRQSTPLRVGERG